ncbi:uncharacterized protein BXZ73DRAFT_11136, partial [Epithele typhae]|uniref:uncharacterized protein n=1 Tax=Epithele typhae TaxID=378194 RepID=UPI0020087B0D
QAISYLHRRRVAHLDIATQNILHPSRPDTRFGQEIVANKLYLIDFEFSEILDLGPGRQPAIELDPYSWDVYCCGWIMQGMLKFYLQGALPWHLRWYLSWVTGKQEQGCAGPCRCRPTTRRALLVL